LSELELELEAGAGAAVEAGAGALEAGAALLSLLDGPAASLDELPEPAESAPPSALDGEGAELP